MHSVVTSLKCILYFWPYDVYLVMLRYCYNLVISFLKVVIAFCSSCMGLITLTIIGSNCCLFTKTKSK